MNKFDFDTKLKEIQEAKKDIPVKLANLTQNYFVENFKRQGFGGEQWKEVKRRIPGTPEYKYPQKPKASSRTSPILMRTRTLYRAVNNSVREASLDRIRLAVELDYADYINNGTDRMPKRQFMGQTDQLTVIQQQKITNELDKIFKI